MVWFEVHDRIEEAIIREKQIKEWRRAWKIRRIVEMNRKTALLTPGALVAIVAPSPLPYAMARLWHTLADNIGWKAGVFHARPDAIAWLRKELQLQAGTEAILDE